MVLSCSLLAGCGSMNFLGGKKDVPGEASPPNALYGQADALMERGKFGDAAKQFEKVDQEHPYAPEARRSIVMSAYSHYREGKYDEAIAGAERYLALHPGTPESDLAQKVLADSYFDQITGPNRDQAKTRKAFEAYATLVQRYPDSRYAGAAQNRMRVAQDLVAANEMVVGRYYMKQSNYVAAINRFKTVVSDYQTTPQVEEALSRLTEAYMAMGIVNEAQTAAAILGHNFPDSKWYKNSYALLNKGGYAPQEDEGSWLSRTWRRVKPV